MHKIQLTDGNNDCEIGMITSIEEIPHAFGNGRTKTDSTRNVSFDIRTSNFGFL